MNLTIEQQIRIAETEFEASVDDLTDWLNYEFKAENILPSLKRVNRARLQLLVLKQRQRRADDSIEGMTWDPSDGSLIGGGSGR
jgi:hypothetical protein